MTESDEDFEKVAVSFGLFVICIAFVSGFALAWYLRGEVEQEVAYREKANFCIDRMENDAIRYVWRQKYCGNVKLDAIDPITGRPVAGIVDGE